MGVGEGPGFGGAGLGVGILPRAAPPGTCGRRKPAGVAELELRGRALPPGTLWYSGRAGLASVLFLFLFFTFSPRAAGFAFSPRPWPGPVSCPAGAVAPRPAAGRDAPGSAALRGWTRSRPSAGRRCRPPLGACACPGFKLYYGVTPNKVVKKSFGARVSGGSR